MLMPEAPVNHYRELVPPEDHVGRARQMLCMEAEAQAHPVQLPPHQQLGLRVFLRDSPHYARACFRRHERVLRFPVARLAAG